MDLGTTQSALAVYEKSATGNGFNSFTQESKDKHKSMQINKKAVIDLYKLIII